MRVVRMPGQCVPALSMGCSQLVPWDSLNASWSLYSPETGSLNSQGASTNVTAFTFLCSAAFGTCS